MNVKSPHYEGLFKNIPVDFNHCFVCGDLLNDENRSEEHVYPKWLQSKFNLWNQKLILLNNTLIRYKDLKIPCCKKCNSTMGEKFEKTIQSVVEAGYDEFKKLNRNTVFLWLNKLSYGILYKEMFLNVDRSTPNKGKIIDFDIKDERKAQFMFLRSILSNTTFEGNPYSLIIFKLKIDERRPYWAYDNPMIHTFFMRMNDIGIMANLMDNSVNEEMFMQNEEMKLLTEKTLHPMQFAEVCARFNYKCGLMFRNPYYISVLDENLNPGLILSPSMSGIVYENWDQATYAKVFEFFLKEWGIGFEDIYNENDLVISFLWNEKHEFIELPLE